MQDTRPNDQPALPVSWTVAGIDWVEVQGLVQAQVSVVLWPDAAASEDESEQGGRPAGEGARRRVLGGLSDKGSFQHIVALFVRY